MLGSVILKLTPQEKVENHFDLRGQLGCTNFGFIGLGSMAKPMARI